jgi:glycosyltransferase involved in cell wall biosynthesis
MRQRLGISAGTVLLYFGRFSTATKADLLPLLLAFRELRRKGRDVWLVLAGDDVRHNLTPGLRSAAASLEIDDRIRILPNPGIESKLQLYWAADIFVSLVDSIQETFGLTLLEAMAAGLPVVGSDWRI